MRLTTRNTALVLIVGLAMSMPAFADKPAWAGKHKDDQYEREDHGRKSDQYEREDRGDNMQREGREERGHFSQQNREYLHEYYGKQFSRGHCPPGLAKKNNGCLPPGQARKWKIGQPLPRDVVYYDLPRRVAAQIGPPPEGKRYVRVANDILLIAVGTGMVLDAVEDLGKQ